jgi:putative transposase
MIRAQQVQIKPSHSHYKLLDGFLFASKNLYNCAVYQFRQAIFSKTENVGYYTLDKLLRSEYEPDYRAMPTAWSAQQVIMLADKSFKGFNAARKAYNANPSAFTGKPRLPKYLHKTSGRQVISLNCKTVKDGFLQFPKTLNGFTVKLPEYVKFINVVRIVPRNRHIVIEIVYDDGKQAEPMLDNSRYAGIDFGLDNLVAIVSNTENVPVLINGKGLKSTNQFWNKRQAYFKAVNDSANGTWYTTKTGKSKRAERSKREDVLLNKRNNRIKTEMHRISRYIVDTVKEWNCNTLVLGHNKGLKDGINIGTKNNQNFVQIPMDTLRIMITYKAEAIGINIITTEESYTSKASAFHNDPLPEYTKDNKNEYVFSGKRKHRGLYISDKGMINADVNGALNIIRKVVRDDSFRVQRIEGYTNPVSVTV